jgi:hypothetical protein
MKGSPAAMSEEVLIAEILPAEWPKTAKGKHRILGELIKNGAAYRTRTCDPIITNDVLYHLS